MQYIAAPLPRGVSITQARNIAEAVERAIADATGELAEATVTDLILTHEERSALLALVYRALEGAGPLAGNIGQLLARIEPTSRNAIVTDAIRDQLEGADNLSRAQELAADAMAGEFGRSRVRHLSDGAVVITGMTDDVERRTVCIERSGRERWRS